MHPRLSEAAVVNRFIANEQNTHTTAVTNSVGVVILYLIKRYFKNELTQKNIENFYQNCLEEMNSYVHDLVRTEALTFLKNKIEEPINRWDEIYLYMQMKIKLRFWSCSR